MCNENKLNQIQHPQIRIASAIGSWLLGGILVCWTGLVVGQTEIPPEVRAVLFPQPSSLETTRDNSSRGQQPRIPEKPRHSFNDSLFQEDELPINRSSEVSAAFDSGRSSNRIGGQSIGLTSFEAPMEYQPVIDRAPDMRPNQAVTVADLPRTDFSTRFTTGDHGTKELPERLQPQAGLGSNRHSDQRGSLASASATIKELPTLAELLEESNRGFKDSKTSPPSSDESLSNEDTPFPPSGRSAAGWSGFRNDASQERFVETLQRIAISVVMVLFLGVSFIVIAKRWLKGTSQLIQPTPVPNPDSKTSAGRNRSSAPVTLGDTAIQIKNQLKLDDRSFLYLIEVAGQSVLVANDAGGIKSVVPIVPSFSYGFEQLEEAVNSRNQVPAVADENRAGAYRPGQAAEPEEGTSINRIQNSHRHLDGNRPAEHQAQMTQTNKPSDKDQQAVEEEMKRRLAELLGGQAFQEVLYQQAQSHRG